MRVSVAIPIYNEREVLPELISRVKAVLSAVAGGPHEIVIVDDGSTEGSGRFLEEVARLDPTLTLVRLARNFGHQIALSAALDHSRGDCVIVMDGDLQDSPEAIPQFLAKYAEGYDVVYARRERRQGGVLLRICYRGFYRVVARLSNVALPLDAGDFALLSRRVVQQIRRAPERHRYLRGLRAWVGFRQVGIPLVRPSRAAGKSKYSFGRLLNLAFDGIFSFSIAPLRAASAVGLLALVACGGFAVYSVIVKLLYNRSPQGFTALIVVITFLSGIQLLFVGLLGEYIGRVYEEVKRRPLYVVDKVIRGGVDVDDSWSEVPRGWREP
jgi:glycosyltransferase involved in cell wall biosynthesis